MDETFLLHVKSGLVGKPVFEGGIMTTIDASADGEPVHVQDRRENFQPVDPAATYFLATIRFYAEGEQYGTTKIHLSAEDEEHAEHLAGKAASFSKFDDDRIPDRHLSVEIDETEGPGWPV